MRETVISSKLFPKHRFSIGILLLCLCPLFAEESEWDGVFLEGEGVTVTESPVTESPVTGSLKTPAQTRVVTKDEIERAHAPDITALLEELLDVGAASYGPYGNTASVHIRGLGAGRVAVLVDGVPVNSPQSGTFGVESININNIERIEVIYGGSDTTFNVSGAMGGVINIITVKKIGKIGKNQKGLRFGGGVSNTSAVPDTYQKRDGSQGDAEYLDLLDTQNINAFVNKGWDIFSFSANLFANRAANHFLFDDYYGIKRRRTNNEALDIGAGISLHWNIDDVTRLTYSGDLYFGDKNIAGTMTSTNYGIQKDFSTRQNLFFDKPVIFRDDLAVEANVSYSIQTLGYEDTAVSLHKIHTVRLANGWSWYAAKNFTLKTGGDYAYNYLDSTNIGVKDGHNGGMYLTGEWGGGTPFLLVPSVKLVFNFFDNNNLVPIPKLGLVWHVPGTAGTVTLKNNYFRAFKFPTFNDRYWSGDATAQGNPDLRPEDGWGADIGAAYKGGVDLETTVYASYVKDSIHWRSISNVWQPVNIGEAAFFGVDARIQKEFALSKGLFITIIPAFSYQYLLTYILTEKLDFASNIRMPYMPEHTFGASLDLRWKTGSAKVSGHYTGARYTETLNIITLKPYFLLNATINQNISEQITAFLVFRNILNTPYVSVQDYPMRGFTVTVGVRARFEKN